jgi:hypothetical protein
MLMWNYAILAVAIAFMLNLALYFFDVSNHYAMLGAAILAAVMATYLFARHTKRVPASTERRQFLWQYAVLLGLMFTGKYLLLAHGTTVTIWVPITLAVHWFGYLLIAFFIFQPRTITNYFRGALLDSPAAHAGRAPESPGVLDYDRLVLLDAEDLAGNR